MLNFDSVSNQMAGNPNVSLNDAERSSLALYRQRCSIPDESNDFGDFDSSLSENKNTKRKTETDMRIFSTYLVSMNELRNAETVPPSELDQYLTTFFSVIKKHDGNEYEAASLRGMLCSIERYLRTRNYPTSLTRDAAFLNTRNMLKERQMILREQAKNVKRTKHETLTSSALERLKQLHNAKEFGPYSPMAVINSLCFAFVVHLRIPKAIDHKQLLWGDIALKTADNKEYLCYEPLQGYEYLRQTLNGISHYRIYAQVPEDIVWDPVALYKLYTKKRHENMMSPESPFYLGIGASTQAGCQQQWYKSSPMGVNKLNDLVRMVRDITGSLSNNFAGVVGTQTISRNLNTDICAEIEKTEGEEKSQIDNLRWFGGDSNYDKHINNIKNLVCTKMYDDKTKSRITDLVSSMVDSTPSRPGMATMSHHSSIKRQTKDNMGRMDEEASLTYRCSSETEDINSLMSHSTERTSNDMCDSDNSLGETEVESAKDKIKEIVRRLRTEKARKELVKWMNLVTIETGSNELQERGTLKRQCRISMVLDNSDLLHLESAQAPTVTNVKAKIEIIPSNTPDMATQSDSNVNSNVSTKHSDPMKDLDNVDTHLVESPQLVEPEYKSIDASATRIHNTIMSNSTSLKRRTSEPFATSQKVQKTDNNINTQNSDKHQNGVFNQSVAEMSVQSADAPVRSDKIIMPSMSAYHHEVPKDYSHIYPPWIVDPRFAMFVRHGLMSRYQDPGYSDTNNVPE